MKKIIIYGIATVSIVTFGVIFYFATTQTTQAQPTVDEQIKMNLSLQGDARTSYNYYKVLKNICLDGLNFDQSVDLMKGKVKYCYEYDELIQLNRADLEKLSDELKEITTQEYERALGL